MANSPDMIEDGFEVETTLDSRQQSRMAGIPEIYRTKHERLCCELALRLDDADAIFASYGYDADSAALLCESQAFISLLERITKEIQLSGLSFKTKAKAIAEEALPYAYEMLSDPQCSSAVRLGTIQWVAKMAGHEPKEAKDEKTGGGLTLNITFAGQAPQTVISTNEPLTIEQN
jgi:hypothetical protein